MSTRRAWGSLLCRGGCTKVPPLSQTPHSLRLSSDHTSSLTHLQMHLPGPGLRGQAAWVSVLPHD